METRVRYIAVGIFTLVIGVAAISFGLWIQNFGTLQSRRDVLIRFQGSTPGLRVGAPVTFNGIRVGEVTDLAFDPNDPSVVKAYLSIVAGTPLSSTTNVELDSEGLMGSIDVSLRGGPGGQPLLAGKGQKMPEIVAPGAISLTRAAQATLTQVQKLVGDNAKPLHETIGNIQTFSAVLAKNSGRIDQILAGLDKLTGGGEQKPAPTLTFNLNAPSAVEGFKAPREAQLVVADPTSLIVLDTQRFLTQKTDGQISLQQSQWADTIPKLVQKTVLQTFGNVKYKFASEPTDGLKAHYQLFLAVEAFQIVETSPAQALVRFGARLMGPDGKIIDARTVEGAAPATAVDGPAAAQAMNQAFAAAVRNLLLWYQTAVAS